MAGYETDVRQLHPDPSRDDTEDRTEVEQTIAVHDPEATHLPDSTPTTIRGYASLGIATVVSVTLVQAATPAVANDNLLNLTSWPAATLGITDAAGLEPLFAGIVR